MNKEIKSVLAALRKKAKEAKTIEEKECVVDEVSSFTEELRSFMNKALSITRKLQKECSEITCKKLFSSEDDITLEKVMSLNWETVSNSDKMYNLIQKWFYKYKYIMQSGYCPETKQVSIMVHLNKNEPPEPQIEEVKQFAPYIKPSSPDRDNYGKEKVRVMRIMESTCSENGCYSIYLKDDDTANLMVLAWSRLEIVKEFDNLDDCLKFVWEYYPHIGAEEDDDNFY